MQGSRRQCEFLLDDTDLEGERLIAEYEQLQAEARHTQAQADQVYIEAGIVSRQEVRDTLIQNDERYANLTPSDLPEMETDPQPEAA